MTTIDYAAKATYLKTPRKEHLGNALLTPVAPKMDARLDTRPALPCAVIVCHGVNDVGNSYEAVEKGLCAGLNTRLGHRDAYVPATYSQPPARTPGGGPAAKVEDDPDAVFYRRKTDATTHSPVIPFYWGFREEKGFTKFSHGQNVDRNGNRLDKDNSKEGGPFANATSTLPDMWNKGHGSIKQTDVIRPTFNAPGRLYMVLAAQRLAALICMIKDYHANDVVNIVAHSQGTLLSLLAQAFLLDWGRQPADTLVLMNSPYGLEDEVTDLSSLSGGVDALMNRDKESYAAINGRQSLHARLQTLVNIAQGVQQKKGLVPAFGEGFRAAEACGMVGNGWQANSDRDNRGKVYVYFSPEDTTVNLRSIQGIGWQGVPDAMLGVTVNQDARYDQVSVQEPMSRLMATGGFFQRVFTMRKRPDPEHGEPVLVGASPHDFRLLAHGEKPYGHMADFGALTADNAARTGYDSLQDKVGPRHLMRRINGEALKLPVKADLLYGSATASELPKDGKHDGPHGAYETVDPIDAAIASSVDKAYKNNVWDLIPDISRAPIDGVPQNSPQPLIFEGNVTFSEQTNAQVLIQINDKKPLEKQTNNIFVAYRCLDNQLKPNGRLLIRRKETPEELRRRFQTQEISGRSFHSATFGSHLNHEQVSAYDLSIGQGSALGNPDFRKYLCAVADWRISNDFKKGDKARPGFICWEEFADDYEFFYSKEPAWRQNLIEKTSDYYTKGSLPDFIPVMPNGLPKAVVNQTMIGNKQNPTRIG